MQPLISPFFFAAVLFLGMLGMLEFGRRLALHHVSAGAEKADLATIEAAVFAMFGLLIAFTFSGAAGRFQEKRMQIVEEANAIESAYMRIDLIAPEAQPELRDRFREYVDARLEVYHRLPDAKAARFAIERSKTLQNQIWSESIAAMRISHEGGSGLLLPAVNDMIALNRARMLSLQNHPPGLVYVLLLMLGLLCSLLAGFRLLTGQRRSWLHMLSFALVTAAVVYLTLDIEYPRVGLIRLDDADRVLSELRARMK